MNTRTLIRLNKQLCISQPKSNPYIAAMKRPAAVKGPARSVRMAPETAWDTEGGSGSGGRGTWLWVQAVMLGLSVTVGYAIVAAQRLEYRRAEHRLAGELSKREAALQNSERANTALVGQIKTIMARQMPANEPEIQPVKFTRQIAPKRPAGARL